MTMASAVTTSPHFDETTQLLDQGLSHRQVHAALVERHGPEHVPSISSLYRYARRREDATVGLGAILPNGAGPVNSLRLVERLIHIQEQRIVRLWQLEQEKPVPGLQLDIALRTMLAYVKQREHLAQARDAKRAERRETEDAADLGFDPIRLEAALEVLREYNRNVAHQDPFDPVDPPDGPPDTPSPAHAGDGSRPTAGGGESAAACPELVEGDLVAESPGGLHSPWSDIRAASPDRPALAGDSRHHPGGSHHHGAPGIR